MPAPFRTNVMFCGVMSGVMTPIKSFGPTTLSRKAWTGADDRYEPSRPTCQPIEVQHEKPGLGILRGQPLFLR